jgi:hypothetical protein
VSPGEEEVIVVTLGTSPLVGPKLKTELTVEYHPESPQSTVRVWVSETVASVKVPFRVAEPPSRIVEVSGLIDEVTDKPLSVVAGHQRVSSSSRAGLDVARSFRALRRGLPAERATWMERRDRSQESHDMKIISEDEISYRDSGAINPRKRKRSGWNSAKTRSATEIQAFTVIALSGSRARARKAVSEARLGE